MPTKPTKKTAKIAAKPAAPKNIKNMPKKPKTLGVSAEERGETVSSAAKKSAASKATAAPAAKSKPYFYANGKRKTSVALVRLFNGEGKISINDRSFEQYFPVITDQDKILSPLRATDKLKSFDIFVRVFGGGIHSQAEAIRHGIAKALLEFDAGLRSTIKPLGFLTRDSRVKERKKYGLRRARRAPQFSKR